MRRALVVLLTLVFLGITAAPALAATVDRRITDPRITESSGLTPSFRFPGVLWTNNDSGNPPYLYAIGSSGATRAALRISGEPDVDWEAVTSLPGPGGPLLAIGDIGDNNTVHPNVRVALIKEPTTLRNATVQPFRVLRLRYPDGPRDAETLMTDPRNGVLYIVSKTFFGADLYQVPESLWPAGGPRVSKVTTLKRVATLPANFVTDGAFLPDGRMLLRGYGRVYVLDRPETAKDDAIEVLASAGLPAQDQGESIAVVDGGAAALIGSEGDREPVYRVPVPAVRAGRGAPTLPPSSGRAPATTGTTSAAAPAGGAGDLGVWAGVVGGALALMALTAGVAVALNRFR
jgi:hypothetical protein